MYDGGAGWFGSFRAAEAVHDAFYCRRKSFHVIGFREVKIRSELESALLFHLLGFTGDNDDLNVLERGILFDCFTDIHAGYAGHHDVRDYQPGHIGFYGG